MNNLKRKSTATAKPSPRFAGSAISERTAKRAIKFMAGELSSAQNDIRRCCERIGQWAGRDTWSDPRVKMLPGLIKSRDACESRRDDILRVLAILKKTLPNSHMSGRKP